MMTRDPYGREKYDTEYYDRWYDVDHESEHAADMCDRLWDDSVSSTVFPAGTLWDAAQPVRSSEYTGAAGPSYIPLRFNIDSINAMIFDLFDVPYQPFAGLIEAVGEWV
jgi:hypothetical protein